jgi:hypothetical protein
MPTGDIYPKIFPILARKLAATPVDLLVIYSYVGEPPPYEPRPPGFNIQYESVELLDRATTALPGGRWRAVVDATFGAAPTATSDRETALVPALASASRSSPEQVAFRVEWTSERTLRLVLDCEADVPRNIGLEALIELVLALEELLGRFDAIGDIPRGEWSSMIDPPVTPRASEH